MQRTTIRVRPVPPSDQLHRIEIYSGYLFEMGCRLSANGWQAWSGFPGSPDKSYRVETAVPEAARQHQLIAFLLQLPNVTSVSWQNDEVVVEVSSYRWPEMQKVGLAPLDITPLMQLTAQLREALQRGDVSTALTLLAQVENSIIGISVRV